MTTEHDSNSPARLGPLEARVMDVLWSLGACTVREVIDALPHDPAYTTIATVLHNLERKALVGAQKDGRSTRYASVRSREEHVAQAMRHALSTSPDRSTSILHFVEAMDAADVRLLEDHLARRAGGT